MTEEEANERLENSPLKKLQESEYPLMDKLAEDHKKGLHAVFSTYKCPICAGLSKNAS